MRSMFIFCAFCLYVSAAYGADNGVGAYAYQDSSGKRYSGTFGLKDGQSFGTPEGIPGPAPEFFNTFFPQYFRNLQTLLTDRRIGESQFPHQQYYPYQQGYNHQNRFGTLPRYDMFGFRTFEKNLENQQLAYNAATKAFDLTSNQAGYQPNYSNGFSDFGSGFGGFNPGFSGFGGFGGYPNFGDPNFGVPNMAGMNHAYASGVVGDGFMHQTAGISPQNPNNPNIDVSSRFAENNDDGGGHFVSVQSSSFATSANVNGKETTNRGASTIINKDGKITEYKIQS